jgi:RecA/RadA recombinase
MKKGKKVKKEKGTVELLVDKYSKQFPPVHDRLIPSRYMAIDYIFGGGFPENRVISITSAWGVGKTLVSLCICLSFLLEKDDNVVLFLDIERGISKNLLINVLGEDYEVRFKDRFILLAPQSYEDTIALIEDFSKTDKLKLVVLDSLTALDTQAVLDDGSGKVASKGGAEALFCKKIKFYSTTSRFSVIYINQQRANLSFSPAPGPKTKMAGSNSVFHYSDAILLLRSLNYDKNAKGEKIGAQIQIKCEKNRIAGNRMAVAFLKYGFGISNIRAMTHFLKWAGVVTSAGAYFDFVCDDFDFGEGMGKKARVYGTDEAENLVREKMADMVEFFTANGKLAKYFEKVAK